jgi:hypothetical protein
VRRPSSGSTMTRARLAALLLTSVCLGVAVGCGSGEELLAKVDGTRIEREDVESLIELYKSRAEAREGEADETARRRSVTHEMSAPSKCWSNVRRLSRRRDSSA